MWHHLGPTFTAFFFNKSVFYNGIEFWITIAGNKWWKRHGSAGLVVFERTVTLNMLKHHSVSNSLVPAFVWNVNNKLCIFSEQTLIQEITYYSLFYSLHDFCFIWTVFFKRKMILTSNCRRDEGTHTFIVLGNSKVATLNTVF